MEVLYLDKSIQRKIHKKNLYTTMEHNQSNKRSSSLLLDGVRCRQRQSQSINTRAEVAIQMDSETYTIDNEESESTSLLDVPPPYFNNLALITCLNYGQDQKSVFRKYFFVGNAIIGRFM